MKRTLLFLGFLLVVSKTVVAGTGMGSQTLLETISARAEGVGGAYVSMVDNADAIYWNPAALSYMRSDEIDASFASGVMSDYYAKLNYANSGNQYYTWAIGLMTYSAGAFDQIDLNGNIVERFNDVKRDWVLNWAGAYRLMPAWRFGWGLEFYRTTILEKYTADTLALNLGNSFDVFDGLRLDIVMRNLGLPTTYSDESTYFLHFGGEEYLPLVFSFGLAYDVLPSLFDMPKHKLKIGTELDQIVSLPLEINAGMEYMYEDFIAARVGYHINQLNKSLSLGAGIKYPIASDMDVQLDYSFSLSNLLDNQHKISLSLLTAKNATRENGAPVLVLDPPTYYPSRHKIGIGIGNVYGGMGINYEYMTNGSFGIFAGAGTPALLIGSASPGFALGGRYYFAGGEKGGFRGRWSAFASNGWVVGGPSSSLFLTLCTTIGFQWRIFQFISWDLDAGVALPLADLSQTTADSQVLPSLHTGITFHLP